jgi:hypothetical protein
MSELLTAEQVADRLHLKPLTVRQWARRGRIPSIKMVILVQSGPTCSSNVGPPGQGRGFPRRQLFLSSQTSLIWFASPSSLSSTRESDNFRRSSRKCDSGG